MIIKYCYYYYNNVETAAAKKSIFYLKSHTLPCFVAFRLSFYIKYKTYIFSVCLYIHKLTSRRRRSCTQIILLISNETEWVATQRKLLWYILKKTTTKQKKITAQTFHIYFIFMCLINMLRCTWASQVYVQDRHGISKLVDYYLPHK